MRGVVGARALRLALTLDAVRAGARTAYEIAGELTWTSRERHLAELDDLNAMLATLETRWHLEVLAERGSITRTSGADGVLDYSMALAD